MELLHFSVCLKIGSAESMDLILSHGTGYSYSPFVDSLSQNGNFSNSHDEGPWTVIILKDKKIKNYCEQFYAANL